MKMKGRLARPALAPQIPERHDISQDLLVTATRANRLEQRLAHCVDGKEQAGDAGLQDEVADRGAQRCIRAKLDRHLRMFTREILEDGGSMLGNQRLVPAGKHHLAHRSSDLVEKLFKFRRGQLPGWAFENGLVAEMAHHASQIALVDDIETECETRLFA